MWLLYVITAGAIVALVYLQSRNKPVKNVYLHDALFDEPEVFETVSSLKKYTPVLYRGVECLVVNCYKEKLIIRFESKIKTVSRFEVQVLDKKE